MNQTFSELVVDGVLIAPFVIYAGVALLLLLLLRPILARVGFEAMFSAPPVAMLSLYVIILAFLIVLS